MKKYAKKICVFKKRTKQKQISCQTIKIISKSSFEIGKQDMLFSEKIFFYKIPDDGKRMKICKYLDFFFIIN